MDKAYSQAPRVEICPCVTASSRLTYLQMSSPCHQTGVGLVLMIYKCSRSLAVETRLIYQLFLMYFHEVSEDIKSWPPGYCPIYISTEPDLVEHTHWQYTGTMEMAPRTCAAAAELIASVLSYKVYKRSFSMVSMGFTSVNRLG